MIYEIQSKSDFQAGASLIVKIPEEELDQKALYTILADKPEFILPFRHRIMDGQIEFIYQIGNRSKLTYLSGSRTPSEYADLWSGILQPLLDCGDWFMTPYSFVLKSEHIYMDKTSKLVSFIYIPSIQACSNNDALKKMVTEVAQQNHVTDISLENKVVWAIQDFNPSGFLQIVKPYIGLGLQEADVKQTAEVVTCLSEQTTHSDKGEKPTPQIPFLKAKKENSEAPLTSLQTGAKSMTDDIAINIPAIGKPKNEEKQKSGLFGTKKEKEVKPKAEKKVKTGIFGKKKQQQVIIQGAAAVPVSPEAMPEKKVHSSYTLQEDLEDDDAVTELDVEEADIAKFRYIGHGLHPMVIDIAVSIGGVFTIGRFDASVGTKQSDFEFDKKTKAVSRRHAAIERDATGYSIVDLDSTAGTFINGQKLPANAPFKLERNSRVSFGHLGADYTWEE